MKHQGITKLITIYPKGIKLMNYVKTKKKQNKETPLLLKSFMHHEIMGPMVEKWE